MKKTLLSTLLALAFSGMASAATNSAGTLTADNEFWLYSGNATGSSLQAIGHGNNWGTAYSFNFSVNPGDYLYVMAWDWGQPHAWQGKFTTPVGTVYSNAANWVASATSSTTVNAAVIGSAAWGGINTELAYNSSPWGAKVNDPGAKWIWSSGAYSADTMVLFRTAAPVAAIPEPESYALLLAGLGLVGVMARRRRAS